MSRLAAVRASRANFTEEKTIAALTEPVHSEGSLVYRRPDHLEKITTSPNRESLMVDGDRLSIVADDQQPRIIELDSEPSLRALVDAVRGTLSGDLAALRRSYDVAMQGPLTAWHLILTPREQSLKRLLRQVTV
ncbi:MAG: outer membrane lipoprotein carrier protein LolA, partial [Alphaproteobacteria bacterium]|nr:outer membrane lipoprotein carrier protein LolA [Alphaproteobacteria bacterium]